MKLYVTMAIPQFLSKKRMEFNDLSVNKKFWEELIHLLSLHRPLFEVL
jgi:hypothetical protein